MFILPHVRSYKTVIRDLLLVKAEIVTERQLIWCSALIHFLML